MPKPRKKRSLTGTEEKNDSIADCTPRVDQDSDTQKPELPASSDSPVPKRAKIGKLKERQHDKYCWNCHFEDCSEECSFCPRVYHMSCLPQIESTIGEWMCPECQAVLLAEKSRANSPVMSLLSTDQLCNLLKYSLQRMEMHVPKDFSFGTASSVIYPMDLSVLEKNIRKRVYTNPAAFLADAKWIIHNHTVHFPLAVPAIKTIMKVCHEEVREIETCPDCYLHAYSMKDKWFSEPCRKPHTLVWAKLKGFPIWPAKAVKTLNGNVDVRFFGGHERAWVPVTQCYFLSRDPPYPISSQKKNFEHAYQEVELHIKLLTQRFGGFEYAPDKTPFNPSQIYLQLNVTLSKLSYLPQSLRDKRKQEATPVPAKRRVGRAHSVHEVQGSRKAEEEKETNLEKSLIEIEEPPTKKEEFQSQPEKTEPLASIEAVESNEDKSIAGDFVAKETVKDIETTLTPLSTENISNENDSADVKVSENGISNLTSPELENNCKEEGSDTSGSKVEDKSEMDKADTIIEETDENSISNLTSLELENDCKEGKEGTSSIKDEDRTETTEKKTDATNSCDQQDATVCQPAENSSCNNDNKNQNTSSTICSNHSAINEDSSNECNKDDTTEVLCNAVSTSVSQEHERVMPNSENVIVEKELLSDDDSELTAPQVELDATKHSNDGFGSVHNIETDLKAVSEMVSNKPNNETEDAIDDGTPSDDSDNQDESKTPNVDHPADGKNAAEFEKQGAKEMVIKNSVSLEKTSEIQSLTSNAALSTGESACNNSSPNMKETAVVVKDVTEDDKTSHMGKDELDSTSVSLSTEDDKTSHMGKDELDSTSASLSTEDDKTSHMGKDELDSTSASLSTEDDKTSHMGKDELDSTSVSLSNPAAMEISKETVATMENSKATEENSKPNVVDSTKTSDKNGVISEESDMKVISVIDHNVKVVDTKAQRIVVQKQDKQTDNMLKDDDKLLEKNEEFHINGSHLDKNPSSSNSIRIRIVKGKVESESTFSNSGKESESSHKIILKTAKPPEEENSVEDSSRSDIVQSKEGQVKTVIRIPEKLSESSSKQEAATDSSVVRKSKRPRKNFIIQFPLKQNQVTHSSSDDKDISSTAVLSRDSEKNTENSNHPDVPGIIKDFKATFEKIQKGKYGKSPVVEKVIDYKSHSAHLNETPQTKGSAQQHEAQKVKSVKTNVTNFPVIIKVPVSNISEHKTSSSDSVSSSNMTNQLSQTPSSSTKPLQITGTKSLQIIAIGNRTSLSGANSTKQPDSSVGSLPKHDLLQYKETEITPSNSNPSSEFTNRKGETSNVKSLNIKEPNGTETKIQEKCATTNILQQSVQLSQQNVQVSLKDNSASGNKEGNSTNNRSQGEAQNLNTNMPFSDKERNLFNILPVEKYARKLTVFLTNTLEEMCQDIINSGCMQVAVHSLETELESVREKHRKDLADVKQNADLVMKEMRATLEAEKQNAVAEVRRQCEIEMRKNVEEAKKKQWCANCGKEAVFYCCWNTSYCDYPCQQSHWPQHMAICGQSHVPSVKEQPIIRPPNLGPEMTITQSPPVLPLEIQLTTPSPNQANKNKKKPSSSNEKITIAPRGKRSLTQSPNASLQPHDISRSSHMIYSPHYRLQNISYTQGGQVIPVMLPHNTPHQQQCTPNVVMENKSHNVQHTMSFQYPNPHACM